MPSSASSSLDLVLTMSCGLTLQRLRLSSVVYCPRGMQFPGTVYIRNKCPLPSALAHLTPCAPNARSRHRKGHSRPPQCYRWRMETRLNPAGGPGPHHRPWSPPLLHLLPPPARWAQSTPHMKLPPPFNPRLGTRRPLEAPNQMTLHVNETEH